MFNRLNITRWNRIINADSTIPLYCKSKWWYNDVFESCDCKNVCKYSKFTKEDWKKYANKCYIDSCTKMSLQKRDGNIKS